jgi:glycosyltransferase involved in cell wall biosynthesis
LDSSPVPGPAGRKIAGHWKKVGCKGRPAQKIVEGEKNHFIMILRDRFVMKKSDRHEGIVKPRVSVIMAAYNVERFVAEAIESVLAQTMKNFELIIDASNDKTGAVIKGYKDQRIRYFEHRQNKGKIHAVNFAFKKARGKYACIFDADDIMVNYKLAVSAKILDRHPECGLVYGDAWIIDEASEIIGPLSFPSRAERNIDDAFPDMSFSIAKLMKGAVFGQGSTLFRMEAIRKVGGLDEKLRVAEDWDLWLRIAEKYKFYYEPVPMYFYRINPQGLFSQALRENNHEKSKQYVIQKMAERHRQEALKEAGKNKGA